MSHGLNRRDFLKIVAAGAGASASLSSCGKFLPGLDSLGAGQPRATICAECPAGCGLLAHPAGGRLVHLEVNPDYPFYAGQICPGAQLAVEKLASPGLFSGPLRQSRGNAKGFHPIGWAEATQALASALRSYRPGELAFVLGLFPDHLNDLVRLLAIGLGGANVLRFDPLGEFEGRLTLMDAAQRLFGLSRVPYFDLAQAGVIFSFGTSFQESWLGQVAGTVRYGGSPRAGIGRDSYLVHFDSFRLDVTAWADEWIHIQPGSQAILARALAALVAGEKTGDSSNQLEPADLELASQTTGVPAGKLEWLARLFCQSERKLAIPGSAALTAVDGGVAAESILALNLLAENLGQPGGLFLAAETLLYPWLASRPSSVAEVQALIERMQSGQVKALFVHGVDLAAALPASFELRRALEQVEQVFSFAPLPDETSCLADYVLPDHLPLESWGYQRVLPGADRPAAVALQPVVPPTRATRASADVLLAAFRAAGGSTGLLPFKDELDFLKQSIGRLSNQGGVYQASDAPGFWQLWQQHGGWWQSRPCLFPPVRVGPLQSHKGSGPAPLTSENETYPYHLALFPRPAARNSDSEFPVEIHPHTARRLGLQYGELVKLVSPAGCLLTKLHFNGQLGLDVLALSWTAASPTLSYKNHKWAGNPLDLLGTQQNSSGNLAFAGLRVRIEPL